MIDRTFSTVLNQSWALSDESWLYESRFDSQWGPITVGPPAQHCGAVTRHALHPHLLALPLVPQGYGEELHSNYRPPAIVLKD